MIVIDGSTKFCNDNGQLPMFEWHIGQEGAHAMLNHHHKAHQIKKELKETPHCTVLLLVKGQKTRQTLRDTMVRKCNVKPIDVRVITNKYQGRATNRKLYILRYYQLLLLPWVPDTCSVRDRRRLSAWVSRTSSPSKAGRPLGSRRSASGRCSSAGFR